MLDRLLDRVDHLLIQSLIRAASLPSLFIEPPIEDAIDAELSRAALRRAGRG